MAVVTRIRAPEALALLLSLAVAGCGAGGYGTDVEGFTRQASAPEDRAVLRSVAAYRTTTDPARACSLVTERFLEARFEGKPRVCEAVARTAEHDLPKSASVEDRTATTARVRVQETTPVRSIYSMRREAGGWRIDAITEAP